MAGRKRKLVGRQNLRPAMRLELARPRTLADFLDGLENKYAGKRRCARRTYRFKTLRTAVNQKHRAQAVPQPAISRAGGRNHPIADPTRGAPTVQPPHQAVIAPLDVPPNIARQVA